MLEAFQRVDDARRVMASNERLSQALLGSDESDGIRNAFPCWSGTMTGHESPGKALGETIEYTDYQAGITYVFPVPQAHRGKENAILVAEHPHFILKAEGDNLIVLAAEVGIVRAFPGSDGWYIGDPIYDIPRGELIGDARDGARRLWRGLGKRVGLVARDYAPGNSNRKYRQMVLLDYPPSERLGVVVEAQE